MPEDSTIFAGTPESWARAVDTIFQDQVAWDPEDFSAIWRHQLTAPVEFEIRNPGGAAPLGVVPETGPPVSFGDLLFSDHTSIPLLQRTKEFAKANMHPTQRWMPREMAVLLYYLCIASAWMQQRQRLSTLDAKQMQTGFLWASALPWIDESSRAILKMAAAELPSDF